MKSNRLLAYYDLLWERNFNKLKAFKQKYGHCRVTRGKNPHLATWVFKQRHRRMDITRRKRLERIGFIFDYFEELWQDMYAKLVKYRATYGNCDVPLQWLNDRSLGHWVIKQRSPGDGRKLKPHRRKLLEKIGFNFKHPSLPEFVFEKRVQELKEFKNRNGHFRITQRNQTADGLAAWVHCLRNRKSRLAQEQLKILDKMKFDWRKDIRHRNRMM